MYLLGLFIYFRKPYPQIFYTCTPHCCLEASASGLFWRDKNMQIADSTFQSGSTCLLRPLGPETGLLFSRPCSSLDQVAD
jgi:hypothetical protein